MKTYEVEIEETLQRVVKIKARNEDEAYRLVKEMYINQEIVLDDRDFMDYEIRMFERG